MIDSEDYDFHKKMEKQQEIYKRIALLGSGSFGKAYLVKHIKEDTQYVIKQLNMVDMTPQQQDTALKEAKILEVLNHPNIVKFKQVYRTSKMKLNIVMEYADGGDLAAKIKQAKQEGKYFQESDILNWFTQICLAVKHIHDRKIIHRDLKGQNIFLTKDNCVKIGDFGVATVLEKTISKAKTVVGSPYYLSPQIISNQPYSFKTDIWSLGAILFQMCSLSPPFTANNLQFLALKIVKGSYSSIPTHYSLQLRNLIRSMLNTNANLRPSINSVLTSRVISNRIKKFLTESQKLHEFSHTVLHNKSVLNPNKQNQSENRQYSNPNQLRPPPNLMKNEDQKIEDQRSKISIENSSHITVPQKGPQSINNFNKPPRTSQITKKGANNFFNRPISGRQKNLPSRNDLTDLIHIHPTAVQFQQKVEKVKLPLVSPPVVLNRKKAENSRVNVSKKPSLQKFNKNPILQKKPIIQIQKKRQSVPINQVYQQKQFKQPQTPTSISSHRRKQSQVKKPIINLQNKPVQKKSSVSNLNKKPVAIQKKINNQKVQKLQINTANNFNQQNEKKQIKNQPNKSSNLQIKKVDNTKGKDFKKSKSIIQPKKQQNAKSKQGGTIQIVSQQFKKKIKQERPKSVQKKNKNFKTKPPKVIKKGISRQVTQQGKINDQAQLQKYQNQNFQPYQMNHDQQDQNDEISLDLSQSQQVSPMKTGQQWSNLNENTNILHIQPYLAMLSQMQKINKYVQMAQGAAANLPMFGQQLPQVFMLSQTNGIIRQDDIEMDTAHLNLQKINDLASQLDSQQSIMKTAQNVDLGCFQDHNNLQNLRMNLQDIFGVQNLIHAYQIIEEVILKENLQFSEQSIIRKILKQNQKMDEVLLRKYFRLIVTVIAMQQQLIISSQRQ